MPKVEVEIDDQRVSLFTSQAMREFKTYIVGRMVLLLDESDRISSVRGSGSIGTQEINHADVQRAVIHDKMGLTEKKKGSVWPAVVQAIGVVSFFIAGVMFDYDEFKQDPALIPNFLILFAVGVVATIAGFLMLREK